MFAVLEADGSDGMCRYCWMVLAVLEGIDSGRGCLQWLNVCAVDHKRCTTILFSDVHEGVAKQTNYLIFMVIAQEDNSVLSRI